MKRIIKRDEKGLYVSAEGSKCRPVPGRITIYREEGGTTRTTQNAQRKMG